MKATFFYLASCNTCMRILKDIDQAQVYLREIKSEPLSTEELETMHQQAGSYEALFSRRARKYRAEGWHEQELGEADYKKLILAEYTFLKRPVLLLEDEIFIGNAKKTVTEMLAALNN
jgi:arsenate reductase-like glutaredoxin family protein